MVMNETMVKHGTEIFAPSIPVRCLNPFVSGVQSFVSDAFVQLFVLVFNFYFRYSCAAILQELFRALSQVFVCNCLYQMFRVFSGVDMQCLMSGVQSIVSGVGIQMVVSGAQSFIVMFVCDCMYQVFRALIQMLFYNCVLNIKYQQTYPALPK